jgi:hypothetical protein
MIGRREGVHSDCVLDLPRGDLKLSLNPSTSPGYGPSVDLDDRFILHDVNEANVRDSLASRIDDEAAILRRSLRAAIARRLKSSMLAARSFRRREWDAAVGADLNTETRSSRETPARRRSEVNPARLLAAPSSRRGPLR